jgi:hypothetical protein
VKKSGWLWSSKPDTLFDGTNKRQAHPEGVVVTKYRATSSKKGKKGSVKKGFFYRLAEIYVTPGSSWA